MFIFLLGMPLVCLVIWKFVIRRGTRRPPGPWGLPFIGHIHLLDREESFQTLYKWYKHYGPIYRIKLGNVPVVVLGDTDVMRKAFRREAFSGKPPLYVTNGIMDGYGLIAADGQLWKEQRKFTVSCLRDFGFSRASLSRVGLEEKITEEVNLLITKINNFNEQPFDIHDILRTAVANLTCSILFGKRFEETDPEFKHQMDMMDEGSALVNVAGLLNFFPFLRHFPFFKRFMMKLLAYKSEHHRFLNSIVEEHECLPDSVHARDFVDAYLSEMKHQSSETKKHYFTKKQLLQLTADLFGAGTETVKVTVKWALLHLMVRPDIQRKVQDEINSVIGRGRNPCLDDIPNLPYTEATVLEAQRLANAVPLGAPHGTTEDTTLDGYYIPKGTMVIGLLWAAHMDPNHWPNPQEFSPERFLDENGRVYRPEHFMPFSVGRRICVGEELAKMSLFLMISNILHRFTIESPIEGVLPDFKPISGFTISPQPYQLRAIHRN